MNTIDVIVPSIGQIERLKRLLSSLSAQTLGKQFFRVLLVVNGPGLSRKTEYLSLVNEYGSLQIDLYWSSIPNASLARNFALSMLKCDYVTFIDDDDEVEPRFLERLSEAASPDKVVLTSILDVDEGKARRGSLSLRLEGVRGQEVAIGENAWLLGFNACKLVPRSVAEKMAYNRELRSGEDVIFWAGLLLHPSLRFVAVSSFDQAHYRRHVTRNSISRQPASFDFQVTQRLDCIAELEKLKSRADPQGARGINSLIESQADFVARYLLKFPGARGRVVSELAKLGITDFPWNRMPSANAKALVISHCFPPYKDPAATVIAKRILLEETTVDVICNDMSSVRELDSSLESLVKPWTDQLIMLHAPNYFSDWNAATQFALKAKKAFRKSLQKKSYRDLYSRSMWSTSHLAAALIKFDDPKIGWTAEFSDPMSVDAQGRLRPGLVGRDKIARGLISRLRLDGFVEPDEKDFTVHQLIEIVTFGYADTFVFTNENQLRVMTEVLPLHLQDRVVKRSVISSQPTLPPSFYGRPRKAQSVEGDKVRIAYFGSFYPNRGLGPVVDALSKLTLAEREGIELHIFSNDMGSMTRSADIKWHRPLPFLSFLHAMNDFDVLVVVDAETGDSFSVNPFLPSKFSDYAGSEAKVWAIVEDGSTLSRTPGVDYQSKLGDEQSILKVLIQLLEEREG